MRIKLINQRKRKKFTQNDMAELLNISRSTYSGYEVGTTTPSLEIAMKIKQILGYKNDDLFFLEEKVGDTDKKKEGWLWKNQNL